MLEPRALLLRECLTIFGDSPFSLSELLAAAGLKPALATVIRATIPALAADPSPGVVRRWIFSACDDPVFVNITLPPIRQGAPLTGVERVQRHRKRRLYPPLPFDAYCFKAAGRNAGGDLVWRVAPAEASNERLQELETA